MCLTSKFSTPRCGVLISLENVRLIQLQIRTQKENRTGKQPSETRNYIV